MDKFMANEQMTSGRR